MEREGTQEAFAECAATEFIQRATPVEFEIWLSDIDGSLSPSHDLSNDDPEIVNKQFFTACGKGPTQNLTPTYRLVTSGAA